MERLDKLAKEYRKTTANQMYGDELGFKAGYKTAQKQIKDRINSLKSKLVIERQPKLNKALNELKIANLEIRIDELEQLLIRM